MLCIIKLRKPPRNRRNRSEPTRKTNDFLVVVLIVLVQNTLAVTRFVRLGSCSGKKVIMLNIVDFYERICRAWCLVTLLYGLIWTGWGVEDYQGMKLALDGGLR